MFGEIRLCVQDCEENEENQTDDAADRDSEESETNVVWREVVACQPDVFESGEEGVEECEIEGDVEGEAKMGD